MRRNQGDEWEHDSQPKSFGRLASSLINLFWAIVSTAHRLVDRLAIAMRFYEGRSSVRVTAEKLIIR